MLTILLRVRVLAGVLLAALLFVPLPASAKTPVKYLFARQPQQQQQANPSFARQEPNASQEAEEAEDEAPAPTIVAAASQAVAPAPKAVPAQAPVAVAAPVAIPAAAPVAAAPAQSQPAMAPPIQQVQASQGQAAPEGTAAYKLGSGDKLRITVFGEPDLSGEFEVDSIGKISMPLVGQVNVANMTVTQTTATLVQILSAGYLRDPKVNIDVLNYRPFFILGEVLKPGSYPYVNGMTIVNAVAMAGGYTYRANDDGITVVRAGDPEKKERKTAETDQIMPGDVVRVPERFF